MLMTRNPWPQIMSLSALEPPKWPDLLRMRRALVVVDMVESVRLIQRHEDEVIDRWRHFVHDVRTEVLPSRGGRMVKSLGDGMLLEFVHTPQAVGVAFDLHDRMRALNGDVEEDHEIKLRIGLHVAEVVTDELDVYGAGVNLVARLAALARPLGVAASAEVIDEVLPGVDATIEDAGRCFVKHIDTPIQVYFLSRPLAQEEFAPTGHRVTMSSRPAQTTLQTQSIAPCLAMMPVSTVQSGAESLTVAELLSDLLLTRLSSVRDLRVISRLSTEQFRQRGLDAEEVSRRTGADFLLSGRLHGQGLDYLFFIELVDAKLGQVIWAQSTRLDARTLLSRDDEILPEIVAAIVDKLTSYQMRKVGVSPLPQLDSHALQFAAVHLMHRQSRAHFERSNEILNHLVERHPRVASPHAWLAKWHVLRVTKGLSDDPSVEGDAALEHTRRALDIDDDLAMAMAMEAFVDCHMKLDLAAASTCLDAALLANPNEPWVWLVRATVEGLLGHGQASWDSALHARALSPLDPLHHYFDSLAASAAVAAQQYEYAQRLATNALSRDASHLPTLRALVIAQVRLGQMAEARETARKVIELQPTFTLARYLANSPRGGEAMRMQWAQALREAGLPES
jgi:class 3 adenylate cyclase/TolB-like protein